MFEANVLGVIVRRLRDILCTHLIVGSYVNAYCLKQKVLFL